MLVNQILRNNMDLPWYNYYLDLTNYLIDELYLQVGKSECLWNVGIKVQEIQETLTTARREYKEEADPANKTLVKTKGFVSKRNKIEKRFVELKVFLEKRELLNVKV